MFNIIRGYRRRRLRREPFPQYWHEILTQNIWQFQQMPANQQEELLDRVKIFVAEKHWEGCGGLTVDEEMQVTIAGQASLLLVGTTGYYFEAVRTVLVYPGSFRRKSTNGWIVDESEHTAIAGEAWQGGPIILSWKDVLHGNHYAEDGYNVVVHEFAHHIDGLDGEMGGIPIFGNAADQRRWKNVMQTEFQQLQRAAELGQRTVLNHYGATNEAEFFAVACEAFVEIPDRLKLNSPELFDMLQRLYRIDPTDWLRLQHS